jgi:hypothetical protein
VHVCVPVGGEQQQHESTPSLHLRQLIETTPIIRVECACVYGVCMSGFDVCMDVGLVSIGQGSTLEEWSQAA